MSVRISEPVQQPVSSRVFMAQRFKRLAASWKKETGHFSNLSKKFRHPAYQEVIAMGKDAIAPILADLKKSKSDWFWALTSITGENPITEEVAGDVNKMAEAWIQWGRARGYGV